MILGDSWSVGAWHEHDVKYNPNPHLDGHFDRDAVNQLTERAKGWGWVDPGTGHNANYHAGMAHFLREQGHTVEMVGKAGSHNITQLNLMKSYIDLDYDLYIWLWTDCIREYDWYREHQQGIHNIYDIHRNTELYVQSEIQAYRPDIWDRMVMIGGNAPLMTEWPCTHMRSWPEAMGHIETGQDHPTVDPVNWRDFVNWCNGQLTIGKEDYDDTDQFSHVHQLWWQWIKSFAHPHKQHHMDFLQRSQDRQTLLVQGADHSQLGRGMMGFDLHPNPDAHEWLTDWILTHHHKN